ncbi:hypothetical protein K488DRAFT_75663 [Vararia minispora EC-137]|uniref:Uncharacterized protein n=1 Tax=Vararia minispora EC-137 TaxID=1314806 RepID=A0ACB8QZ66_9AGAM|nr:hypothetical protein K488DRAFT_75663 [Vararia minispora EC-137]
MQTLSDRQDADATSIAEREAPWFTENFYTTKHPATRTLRSVYAKIFLAMPVILIIFMMGVLPIYWGALWKAPQHVHGLNAWVVDYDGGEVGQFITQLFHNASAASSMTLNFQFVNPNPDGEEGLIRDVVDEKAWIIVSVNANATNNLNQAVSSANAAYNASLAVTVYGEEARNENAYRSLIRPIVEGILEPALESFAVQFIRGIEAQGANVGNLAATAPQVLTRPVSYTIYNTRPFDVPVASAVSFVGLIYLLVLAFFITMVHWVARVDVTHIEDHLSFGSLITIRILNPFAIYFFLSLFYSLISLEFQTPFSRYFGSSGFVIYWMMSWMSMSALGFSTESVITILTPRFIPFFLLIWIVVNVSVCFFPIQALPAIFRYGYAMPFYNVSRTVRTIVFNTKNQIGLNFGIQIAWIVVSITGIVVFQWIRRRSAIKARQAALERECGEKNA